MFKGRPVLKKLGKTQVVDAETGKVVEERKNTFLLLQPPADKCQVCASDHLWDLPHNQQSLYYQYRFYAEHGRWPTWTDAMQHCTPETQAQWREGLIALVNESGLPIPDDLADRKSAGR